MYITGTLREVGWVTQRVAAHTPACLPEGHSSEDREPACFDSSGYSSARWGQNSIDVLGEPHPILVR